MSKNADVLRKMSGLDEDEFDEQKGEIEQFIQNSAILASLICAYDGEKAEAVIEAAESYDTLVSMFDPTRWMQSHKDVERNAGLVKAINTAKKKLHELGLCPEA